MYFKSKLTNHLFILIATVCLIPCIGTQAQPNQNAGQAPQMELKEDFKEKELKKFIDANQEVMTVRQNNEQEMMNIIEDGGLDVKTFNQILSAKQRQQKPRQASEDQIEKFETVIQDVIKLQQTMQAKMAKAINESGLEVQQYDEIMYAYQNSEKVKSQVDNLLQSQN